MEETHRGSKLMIHALIILCGVITLGRSLITEDEDERRVCIFHTICFLILFIVSFIA